MSNRKKTKRKHSDDDIIFEDSFDEPEAGDSGATWSCQSCTFINRGAAYKCGVCGTRKGTSTRRSRLSGNVVEMQKTINDIVLKQVEKEKLLKKKDKCAPSTSGSNGADSSDGKSSTEPPRKKAAGIIPIEIKRELMESPTTDGNEGMPILSPGTSTSVETNKPEAELAPSPEPSTLKVTTPEATKPTIKTEITSPERRSLKPSGSKNFLVTDLLTNSTNSDTMMNVKVPESKPVNLPEPQPKSAEPPQLKSAEIPRITPLVKIESAEFRPPTAQIIQTAAKEFSVAKEKPATPASSTNSLNVELSSQASPTTSRQSSETDSSSDTIRSLDPPSRETPKEPGSTKIPDHMIYRNIPKKIVVVANGVPAVFYEFPRRIP